MTRPLTPYRPQHQAACYSIGRRRWWFLVSLLWLMVLITYSSGTAFGYWLSSAQNPAECLTVVGDEPADEEFAAGVAEGDSSAPPTGAENCESAQSVSYILREGDSLHDALAKFGVPPALVQEWEGVARPLYQLSRVHPGQSFELAYAGPDRFLGLTFRINSERHLVISRDGDGWRAEMEEVEPAVPEEPKLMAVQFHYENGVPIIDDLGDEPIPADDHPHALVTPAPARAKTLPSGEQIYAGRIGTSFYEAAQQGGLSPGLIMSLIEIFTWDVDFRRDFRSGDRFEVLVAGRSDRSDGRGERRVLAAKIEAGGQAHWAYYYKDGKRSAGYYDENGNSLGRFALLCPVKQGHVSSGYSYRRFHPILHYFRPHLAVDYEAPVGTAIRAPAAGMVEFAGWKGDYGRYLSLRHNSTYTTTYGHLSRYGSGIKRGARVKQGQIIGYVGSSGLSTGSHLCYRILKNGKSVNPLKFKGSAGPPVTNRKEFNAAQRKLETKLSSARPAGAATSTSLAQEGGG